MLDLEEREIMMAALLEAQGIPYSFQIQMVDGIPVRVIVVKGPPDKDHEMAQR